MGRSWNLQTRVIKKECDISWEGAGICKLVSFKKECDISWEGAGNCRFHRKHGVDNAHLMLKTWSSGFPWKSNIRINF